MNNIVHHHSIFNSVNISKTECLFIRWTKKKILWFYKTNASILCFGINKKSNIFHLQFSWPAAATDCIRDILLRHRNNRRLLSRGEWNRNGWSKQRGIYALWYRHIRAAIEYLATTTSSKRVIYISAKWCHSRLYTSIILFECTFVESDNTHALYAIHIY